MREAPIIHDITQTIERHRLLKPGDRVAAAVSAGADSVALIEILLRLRERLGLVVSVAHFNHRLRGAESECDARFVADLASRHGLAFHSGTAEAPPASEARARRVRYAFLRGLVESNQADRVATGHTVDDQAETVLLRLLRGAGTRGLAGIFPKVDGWLVRPLLGTHRHAVRAWLNAEGVPWREDSSNLDRRYARNRLRHDVWPLLLRENPRLVQTLAATADVSRAEEAWWRGHAAKLLRMLAELSLDELSGETLKLQLPEFVQLSEAEQRRVLRTAFARMGFNSPTLAQVEAGRRLAEATSGGVMRLPAETGLELSRDLDRLVLRRTRETAPSDYEFRVSIPGECAIPSIGRRLRFNLVGREAAEQGYNQMAAPLLDLNAIEAPLVVRNWRPGDRIESSTGQGDRKIKRLLLERRIPREERRLWPVVVSGGRIVWARGLPVPKAFRFGPASAAGVSIQEEGLADATAGNPAQ